MLGLTQKVHFSQLPTGRASVFRAASGLVSFFLPMGHVQFRASNGSFQVCCLPQLATQHHRGCHNWLLCRKQAAPSQTSPHHRYLLPVCFFTSTEQLSTACVRPEVFVTVVHIYLPKPHMYMGFPGCHRALTARQTPFLRSTGSPEPRMPGGSPPSSQASARSII